MGLFDNIKKMVSTDKSAKAYTREKEDTQRVTLNSQIVVDPDVVAFGLNDLENVFASFLYSNKKIKANDDLNIAERRVFTRVQKILESEDVNKHIPHIPEIINQLLEELKDPDSTFHTLSNIVKEEPSVAGSLLRMSNSVYYNPQARQIVNLEHALFIIGQKQFHSLVMTIMISGFFESRVSQLSLFYSRIWQQTILTARFAKQLAKLSHEDIDAEEMYLAGLLFNTGKMIIYNIVSEILQNIKDEVIPSAGFYQEITEHYAIELSVIMAKDWQLPKDTIKAFRQQEQKNYILYSHESDKILFRARLYAELKQLLDNDNIDLKRVQAYFVKNEIDWKEYEIVSEGIDI